MEANLQTPTLYKSLFEYKAWANTELLSLMQSIDANTFPDIIHSALRGLNHAYVVDAIFKGHLLQVPHGYESTNTLATPSLQDLACSIRDLDAWYMAYAVSLAESALKEFIEFRFTDGDKGRMTREETLLHVITHGGYHRGQVGQILRGAAVLPPRDIFTRFLHATEPARRGIIP